MKNQIRILLAEDDIISQKVLKSIIERIGYQVDIVSNGKDALKALEETPYNLVLMDGQMPELDGYEATTQIRDSNSKVINHKVPVIALTGYSMDRVMEKCLKAGMDDYLSKPVKPQQLYNLFEKWLPKDKPLLKKQTSVSPIIAREGILDLSILMNNLPENIELVSRILYDFCKYLPDMISELKKAYNNNDAHLVARHAHTIKGSSANVGAIAIQEIVEQIEILGETGDLKTVDLLLLRFDEQFEVLEKTIERLETMM